MPFCGECGAKVGADQIICPNCGKALQLENNIYTSQNDNRADAFDMPLQEESVSPKPDISDFSSYGQFDTNADANQSFYEQQTGFDDVSSYQTNADTYEQFHSNPLMTQKPRNGLGIAALVLGICSLFICFCYGIGVVPAIIALIFGIIQNKKYANGIATAGIVLGIVGILINLAWLLYFVFFYINIMPDLYDYWYDFYDDFYDESSSFSSAIQTFWHYVK